MKDLWQQLQAVAAAIANSQIESKTARQVLFDCPHAAENVAFMLNGKWDNCNGVTLSTIDEIALETSAKMTDSSWCYEGKSCALLPKLSVDVLKHRYQIGDRYFMNANLTGADLSNLDLSQINLGWAKLQGANLSGTNLRGADLTGADFSGANLERTDLIDANLTATVVSETELSKARLK